MIDDNQKRFILHLGIETKLFHSAFVNLCMMLNQRRSQSAVRLTAHLPIECWMGNYCTRWGMGDGRTFLKTRRDVSFKKGLSNEPTFGLIHLAGQFRGPKKSWPPQNVPCHKVIVPQKKIMARSFLNSGTLIVKRYRPGTFAFGT